MRKTAKTTALLVSLALAVPTASAFAQTAASGNDNQAVATTSANAMQPAHGSNSFTEKQVMHRLGKHGYSDVKDLTKDDNGVWHGTATHDGAPVKVWLDYKGNIGTE